LRELLKKIYIYILLLFVLYFYGLAVSYVLSHFVKLVLNDTFYCACKYDNTVDARLLLFVLYSFLVILLSLVLLHLECE